MAGEVPAETSPVGCNTSNSQGSSPHPDPIQQQQLNSSVDSGIAVLEAESPTLRRRQRLHQCQRILQVLQRDQLTHQQLRDRLSKLANKKWRKEESSSEDHACNVCCADLDLSSAKNYVTCCTCEKSVCRGPKCADWRPKDAKWECQLCQSSKESLAHTSSWVAEQMSFNQHKFVYPMRARSEVYIPIVGDGNDSSMQFESVSQIGQNAHMDERAKIREYVEEIVAEMLGGNLDHVKVGQLSKSENYLPAIVNGHTNNSNNNNNNNHADSELADLSQTRLRSLIETIIAETLRSSTLSASGAVSEISLDTRSHVSDLANGNGLKRRHRTEHYFEPKIYQDLLATAVLNKIVDKEGNTRLAAESTPDLSGRHIDENFNAEALSTTSGSSIEPRSDCSLTDHEIGLDNGKSQSLQTDLERESVLSDYIAAHMVPLPDFSASVTESEDDIGSISSGMIGDGNWEDNWLFKKKRSSATPSSIGMLVPAPRENVRAQIGDKTTDEVSDLSEIGSDIEESSLDLLRCNDLNDRLLSKHLIGGQNTKMVLDELVDRTSLTSHTLPEENEPAFTETTNEFVVSPMAMPSDIKAPSPTPPPPPMIFQDDLLNEEPDHTPIAGSIAEREVKKWYNAVEMPNNPYSPEALKQRISGTQERYMDVPNISPSAEQKALASALTENPDPPAPKADYKRYSRDYYINNAPTSTDSTGGGKAATTSAGEDVEDIVINEVNQEPEPHPPHGRISSGAQSTAADLSHWTLSTPVRRSSSLKFINSRPFHSPSPSLGYERSVPLERPSTSASHYRESSLGLGDDDDFDLRSQRSWRSSYSSLPKRHTQSSLSLHSNGSGVSFGSSVSKRRPAAGGPSAGVLTQFEKQLLHKDLKRNSFRAVSATSKDFVMNRSSRASRWAKSRPCGRRRRTRVTRGWTAA
uniref:RE23676p n=1 Tax=Drosophila melanogaster TaxID=7227 RepID=F3YDQ1_DROME|nr:RE23676p [Drosophila melanogaster]